MFLRLSVISLKEWSSFIYGGNILQSVLAVGRKISDYLKFILPSLVGIFLLMVPFQYEGETTIMVALLANLFTAQFDAILPTVVLLLIGLSAIFTFIYRVAQPKFINNNRFLKDLFDVSWVWTGIRIAGFVLAAMTYFEWGPSLIWSMDTGGLILYDLIKDLLGIFLFAGFLLPFLTDFGLLEFIGSILTPVMRPVFDLPGGASIDCIASWVGDGTIGVALTNKQYEEGYYNKKEATVIATTFSAVSITFSLVVIGQVGLAHLFGPYYLTVATAGIVAAMILPKIPPLSRIEKSYYRGNSQDKGEKVPKGYTNIGWGLELAVDKAKDNMSVKDFLYKGTTSVVDLWLGVFPVIMAFGSLALILVEYTPIFQWLGVPFIPLLKLLGVPYAVEASQTIMVGFADMFLPSVISANIPSEMTRFIMATLSVTQLIYLSESGAVMLGTKMDIRLWDLFVIFILRTLITLPIIVIAARIIF